MSDIERTWIIVRGDRRAVHVFDSAADMFAADLDDGFHAVEVVPAALLAGAVEVLTEVRAIALDRSRADADALEAVIDRVNAVPGTPGYIGGSR